MILIQTDGSASVGIRVGGWAYLIYQDDKLIAKNSDYEYNTTNIRMEVTAIKKALRMTRFLFLGEDIKIQLETDSQWACKCLRGEWNCIENIDLLEEVTDLYIELDVDLVYVPRSKLKKVDKLARTAMKNGKKKYAR